MKLNFNDCGDAIIEDYGKVLNNAIPPYIRPTNDIKHGLDISGYVNKSDMVYSQLSEGVKPNLKLPVNDIWIGLARDIKEIPIITPPEKLVSNIVEAKANNEPIPQNITIVADAIKEGNPNTLKIAEKQITGQVGKYVWWIVASIGIFLMLKSLTK